MNSKNNNIGSLGLVVADHISAMLAYWDKDLVCRFANAAYVDWFGKTSEEMIDKITIKELLGPLYEKNLPYISGALEGKRQTFEREIVTPSGELRYSIANYYPHVVGNEVKGFFVHVGDISPVKLLENELVESNKKASEQNKRLVNFANIVSHNLGNYAHGFAGLVGLLAEADSDEERSKLVGNLEILSKNFSETIENLKAIVHVQNMISIKAERINLNEYIARVISILHVNIISNRAIIKNEVGVDAVVAGVPAYMESIFVNILTNAIKYRHQDRDPVIELKSEIKNGEVLLIIKDNGRGIDLEKYGGEFFGLYKTFHGNSDAHGIGLYITKLQIEAMGGRIDVESQESQWTKFTIHFAKYE